jgi:hypothetical protein
MEGRQDTKIVQIIVGDARVHDHLCVATTAFGRRGSVESSTAEAAVAIEAAMS